MRFFRLIIFLSVLMLATVTSAVAETEYQVKAAMLYNFAKFVEWPPDSFGGSNQITFCIAGKSPINGPVLQMQGKLVKKRTVMIRQIDSSDAIAECQLLFIPQSEYSRLPVYVQQARHYSILTVSDQERFVTAGGMIGFYEEDGRVRFEINQDAAQKRRLAISSQLLNLARKTR